MSKEGVPGITNDTKLALSNKDEITKDAHFQLERALPDLEEEAYGEYVWKIDNWLELDRRENSPIFNVGEHQFRITFFPQGTLEAPGFVSLYLEYVPSKTQVENGYACCVQFALLMSNAREPSAQVASATHCRYTKDIPDWGFTRYYDSRKLLVRTGGQTRPIIENGSVLISAHVRVLRDVTGVLWHPLLDYDSKVATGFVGLKNQGATCYMNSLLQSLYIIPAFRRCVYQIPTEDDSPSDSVAYALQRCFYNLEYSKDAVSTIELTKSFGWDSLDSFMQHDVQEFNRVLQDNLEKRMKGTPVEDALTKLFVGKMKSYICCVDVNFESAREEDFWDIQLNVKGMKDMEESFRDYIQVEMLEGDNCYHADTYGLQRARKGVIFESFPPILHIQLKRFEYDFERDMMIKINDRYEFPLEFDASPYMDEAAKTPGQKIQYVLHGVLVHSGDLHAGHYYALLKPGKDDKWFKFDDNRVTPAMLREVLEENYGGDTVVYPPYKPAIKLKRCMSAYMLVYLRKDKIDELFAPIAREEIPQHLRTVLDEEIRIQDEKRKERAESHLYTNVRIVTKSSFAQHHEFDLANFDDPYDAELVPQMRLLKSTKFSDFVTDAAKQFKLESDNLRFWFLVKRKNGTFRVESPISESDATLETLKQKWHEHDDSLYLFMEEKNETTNLVHSDKDLDSNIFVFLKYFDAEAGEISGIGPFYVKASATIGSILDCLRKLKKLPKDTPLTVYEEIEPGEIDELRPNSTFARSGLGNGDIICFQNSNIKTGKYKNARELYAYIQNRVLTTFRPRYIDQEHTVEFELLLDQRLAYNDICKEIGDRFNVSGDRVRLTTCNSFTYAPNTVVPNDDSITLKDIIQVPESEAPCSIVFYEIMEISLSDLNKKRPIEVTWLLDGLNHLESLHLYVNKSDTILDVLNVLKEQFQGQIDDSKKVRFYEISNGKFYRDISLRTPVRSLSAFAELIGETIPDEEVERQPEDRVVHVYHFHKEINRIHGVPFRFVLKPNESFSETKIRLMERTRYPPEILAATKFALVDFTYNKVRYLDDEDNVYDLIAQSNNALALDHANKNHKKSSVLDRAIQMKG